LTPAIAASSELEFVEAVANIYGTVLFTDFPTRSEEIAAEIRASGADIVGLQEVSVWTVTGGGGAVPSLDFLEILKSDLGPGYSVEAVSRNAMLGPFPLAPRVLLALRFSFLRRHRSSRALWSLKTATSSSQKTTPIWRSPGPIQATMTSRSFFRSLASRFRSIAAGRRSTPRSKARSSDS
jgi:hypothetical protein